MTLTPWVKRRWYRSLLPIAVGGLCFVTIKHRLLDVVDSLPTALSGGVITGVLWACLTVAVTAICSMQASSAVRSMLLVIACRCSILGHDDALSAFSSVLPESLFLVVGALLCELLRQSDADEYLTGPGSRCLGSINQTGDWCLVTLLAIYASGLMLSRAELRAAEFLPDDAIIAVIFAAIGFCTAWATRSNTKRNRGWPFHLIATIICTGVFVSLLVAMDTRLQIPVVEGRHLYWFAICGGITWYATQYGLSRWLIRCGWRWKRKRDSLVLLHNRQIDFVATTRLRNHIAIQGWTSIAGVFVLMSMIALIPESLGWLTDWQDDRRSRIDFDSLHDGLLIVTGLLCAMATFGTVSVVTVSVVPGLLRQSVICAMCYIGVGLSWSSIAKTEATGDDQDALRWAAIALPVVLLARSMQSVSRRFTRIDVGVRKHKPQPLVIRRIMLLTLLVGIEIVVIQAAAWETRLIAVIIFTSLVGVLLTFMSLRRHLGRRTWTNLLCLTIATPGLIGLFCVAAYYEDASPVVAFFVASFFFSCLYVAIWWSLGWLQHIGWTIQPSQERPLVGDNRATES